MDSVLVPGDFEFIDTDRSLRPRRDDVEHESDPLTGPTDSVDDPHYDPGIRFDPKDVVRIKATAATNGTDVSVRARRPSSRISYVDDGIAYDAPSKTYTCEICGKRSVWKYFMERHRRTHIGRRVERGSIRDRTARIRTSDANRQGERNKKLRLRKKKSIKLDDTNKKRLIEAKQKNKSVVEARIVDSKISKRSEIETNHTLRTKKAKETRFAGTRTNKKLNGTARSDTERKINRSDMKKSNRTVDGSDMKKSNRTDVREKSPEKETHEGPNETDWSNAIELSICTFCDRRLGSDAKLRRHVEAHAAGRRFVCETCDRRFLHRTSLRRHLQVHMDEDDDVECPTVCQICEKVFRSRRHLKMHLTTHV